MGRRSLSGLVGGGSILHRLICAILVLLSIAASSQATSPKIEPSLLAALEKKGKDTAIVMMAAGTKDTLKELESKKYATREERLNAVNKALTENAAKSQEAVLKFLEGKRAESEYGSMTYESRWINNSVVVAMADLALLEALANFAEVGEIKENKKIQMSAQR